MSRSRKSARDAGQKFERSTADYLAREVDDRIDVRPKNGIKDRGDIGGVRLCVVLGGARVVIECKNHTGTPSLGPWAGEAEVERINDGAVAGVVIHKRHGKAAPGDQWVTCTLRDFVALITGTRPDQENPT